MKKIVIGIFNDEAADSKTTIKQIQEVKKYELCLQDENGNPITWEQLDNPKNECTLFQTIINDRKLRIDQKIIMADRPNFCVVTIDGNKIIRLEYYQGHDSLSLVYDIRTKEYCGKPMENYLDNDFLGHDFVNDTGNLLIKLSGSQKGPIMKKIFEIAHYMVVNKEYRNYLARPSITLQQHQEDLAKMIADIRKLYFCLVK